MDGSDYDLSGLDLEALRAPLSHARLAVILAGQLLGLAAVAVAGWWVTFVSLFTLRDPRSFQQLLAVAAAAAAFFFYRAARDARRTVPDMAEPDTAGGLTPGRGPLGHGHCG